MLQVRREKQRAKLHPEILKRRDRVTFFLNIHVKVKYYSYPKERGNFSPIHFWWQRERGEGGKKGYRMNIQAFNNSRTNSELI